MAETPKPAAPDRATEIRQQAKANAKSAGKDWSTLSKDDRKVLMDAVRVTMKADREARRAQRDAAAKA